MERKKHLRQAKQQGWKRNFILSQTVCEYSRRQTTRKMLHAYVSDYALSYFR